MNCKTGDITEVKTWQLVPPNCINPSLCNTDSAYVSAITVCNQNLAVQTDNTVKTPLAMPTGYLDLTYYDNDTKVKFNIIFESQDENAQFIEVYRNTSQTIKNAIHVGTASVSAYLFIDDLGSAGLGQTFYYYIKAVAPQEIDSKYRLLGSITTITVIETSHLLLTNGGSFLLTNGKKLTITLAETPHLLLTDDDSLLMTDGNTLEIIGL